MTTSDGTNNQADPKHSLFDDGEVKRATNLAAVAAMDCGVVFQDMDGLIRDYNEAACRILRLSPEQMEGKSSYDPNWGAIREDGSDFPGKYHPAMVTLQTGKPIFNIVMGITLKGHEPRWIEINTNSVDHPHTGERIGVVSTFIDITPQRRIRNALAKELLPTTASTSAKAELGRLFADFIEPGDTLSAHTDVLYQYCEESDAPTYVKRSINQLQSVSDKIMQEFSRI